MVVGLTVWNMLFGQKPTEPDPIIGPHRNEPRDFDESWLEAPFKFNADGIEKFCNEVREDAKRLATNKMQLVDLISYLDLTTLSGDDTPRRVRTVADRSLRPLEKDTLRMLDLVTDNVHCAAVCVYPARVSDVVARLNQKKRNQTIGVASVAGGFPSGQYKLKSRLLEIRLAIEDGATEIDTVLNRAAALTDDWQTVYDEVRQMRELCGQEAHLKTILATGELKTYDNIFKASMASMMAGSDFIKTSTGKESVNATLEVSYVMCQAIRLFHEKTGIKVGFKPAGGVSTPEDGLSYRLLVQKICGEAWITPHFFRIGASRLLDNIDKAILA